MYKTALVSLTILSALLLQDQARADFLSLTTNCNGPSGPVTMESTNGSGPLTYSASCLGNPSGTFTQNDVLSYASLDSTISASYSGSSSVGASLGGGTEVSGQNITVGGIASGTPIDVEVEMQISGSYSYSIGSTGIAAVFLNPSITIGSSEDGTELIPIYACGAPGNIDCASNSGSIVSTSGSGAYSYDFFSDVVGVTAGTALELQLVSGVGAQAADGTTTVDDPASIINIEVTNPSTGLSISGVTITSDAGAVFPVNGGVSSVPEPNSIFLLAGALLLVGLRLKCKRSMERA